LGSSKKSNKDANEKIVFDKPCSSTSTFKKASELQWFDTTTYELQVCITLCILQSQVKKDTVQSYWSTEKSTETYYPSVMPLKHFILLSRYLRFVENEPVDDTDQLGKVRYVVEYVNQKFL
jgi:hypothetical protein